MINDYAESLRKATTQSHWNMINDYAKVLCTSHRKMINDYAESLRNAKLLRKVIGKWWLMTTQRYYAKLWENDY